MTRLKDALLQKRQPEVAASLNEALLRSLRRQGVSPFLCDALSDLTKAMADEFEPEVEAATRRLRDEADREGAQELCLKALSRIGMLYDLAGLTARANVIAASRDKVRRGEKKPESGGPRDTIAQMPSLAEAIRYLNLPVFEAVLTSHPTNVNSLDSVRALRRLGLAVDALRRAPAEEEAAGEQRVEAAMDHLAAAPVLPQEKQGDGTLVPGRLRVSDETRFILRTMANVYKDQPRVYQAFEEPLQLLAAKTGESYDPLALNLQQRFSSWGSSGDKDGNSQVNADTTLEAIGLHRDTIYALYRQDIAVLASHLANAGFNAESTRCAGWAETLKQAQQALALPLNDIAKATRKGTPLSPAEFDRLEQAIGSIRVDTAGLLAEVGGLVEAHPLPAGIEKEAVDLYRRIRNFGDNFARIEYRETAVEYSRVVDVMLQTALSLPVDKLTPSLREVLSPLTGKPGGYAGLDEPARQALLTRLIESGEAPALLSLVWPRIEAAGQGRPYDATDSMPIAYQTMRRMQLARDFPSLITANVLAECEHTSHLLEAQLLQEASCAPDGRRAVMGIVPLFEAPEVMDRIETILRDAYANPAYQSHLAQVAGKMQSLGLSEGKKTQQVQFAHSDNTRRAGIPAARARIYRGHEVVQALGKEFGLVTEEFHGNGQSDSLRGGVRSTSAMTNMFNSHRFMKFTYQGGDLVNYFNDPNSVERLYTRNFSHSAKVLWQTDLQGATPDYDATHGKNVKAYNDLAVTALSATVTDYQQGIFDKPDIGYFLAKTRDEHGNVSSRASSRGKKAQTDAAGIPYIDAKSARTITFSESFQHAGIVPTFFGSLTLEECLRTALVAQGVAQGQDASRPTVRVKLPISSHGPEDTLVVPTQPGAPLDPAIFRHFYYKSAVFRDVLDRMAFGLAMTDLDHAANYNPALAGDAFLERRIKPEYRVAVRLVEESMLPEHAKPATGAEGAKPGFTECRDRIRALLPHLEETMRQKTLYMRVIQSLKRDWMTLDAAHHGWIMALAHAGNDHVTYGRFFTADDPKYSAMIYPPQRSMLRFGVTVGSESGREAA